MLFQLQQVSVLVVHVINYKTGEHPPVENDYVLLGGRSLAWQLRCRVMILCISFITDSIRCDKLCTEARGLFLQ